MSLYRGGSQTDLAAEASIVARHLARSRGDSVPRQVVVSDVTAIGGEASASTTGGVSRVLLGVDGDDGYREISLTRKHIRHATDGGLARWRSDRAIRHPFYWRREALISTAARATGPGILAPECHGVFNYPNWNASIWFDDVGNQVSGRDWSLQDFEGAAFALGKFQAEQVSSPDKLNAPWVSRSWLDEYRLRVEESGGEGRWVSNSSWQKASVVEVFGRNCASRFHQLWNDGNSLAIHMTGTPQTYVHNDFHHDNIFAEQMPVDIGVDITAIDWALSGRGALGADPSNLVLYAVSDRLIPACDVRKLWSYVEKGYLSGVAAGATDARRAELTDVARLGMAASAVAKWSWFSAEMISIIDKPDALEYWKNRWQAGPEEILDDQFHVAQFLFDLNADCSRLLAKENRIDAGRALS